jgi:hypothetical protein
MPHVVRTGIAPTRPHGPKIGTELNQDVSAAMDTAAIKAAILGTGAIPVTRGDAGIHRLRDDRCAIAARADPFRDVFELGYQPR